MALPEPRQPGRPQGGGDTGWGPTGMSQPGKQQQLLMATLPALGGGWGAGLVLSPVVSVWEGLGARKSMRTPGCGVRWVLPGSPMVSDQFPY